MNREEAKDRLKEASGKVTRTAARQAEGRLDQAKGKARSAWAAARDVLVRKG
jgi:uncharacterized protein YjbJ (UPF0337 family)